MLLKNDKLNYHEAHLFAFFQSALFIYNFIESFFSFVLHMWLWFIAFPLKNKEVFPWSHLSLHLSIKYKYVLDIFILFLVGYSL